MVLFFTMLKEAYEDYQRFKQDKEMNARKTQIYDRQSGKVKEARWQDIYVGDIVKVEINEEVPADLLLIMAPKDIVFVSTMNLDGETNLKDREIPINLEQAQLAEFKG